MKKEEWESIYKILDRIHSDFLLEYHPYKNGKNKKIRADAERKLESAVRLADFHIRKNAEVYYLLTGENNNDFGRTLAYEEFLQLRYFGNDMSGFIAKD